MDESRYSRPPVPKKYWMVHCLQNDSPVARHASYDSAYREALRLSGMNPGRQFVVLEAVGVAVAPHVAPSWVRL